MDGRINRGSLTNAPQSTDTADSQSPRGTYYTPRRSQSRYSGRSGGRKRSSYNRREVIPDGKDFLTVQILASGILLLFVMFISLVPSSQTLEVREKLKNAFSKQTTAEEAAEGLDTLKSTLSRLDEEELTDEAPMEKDTPETDDTAAEDMSIDPNVLREINEMAGSSKN